MLRLASLLFVLLTVYAHAAPPARAVRFTVALAPALRSATPGTGRLFVVLSRSASREPRLGPGWADDHAEPFFGKDVATWDGKAPLTLADDALGFPEERLSRVAPGVWYAQALYDTDTTFSSINAPGNLTGPPVKLTIPETGTAHFALILDRRLPDDALPPDTAQIQYVKIQSRLLSAFWKKPMFLRAAVILPAGYAAETERRYPLRVQIGGYGSRYTRAPGVAKRGKFEAPDTPPMLCVCLDGEAPFGDSYQVNSANNGPYGDATVQELIPEIERRYRAIGKPAARLLDGGSTGGWVALALQIYYPDFFGGAWSFFGDGVDFRGFQLVNIYADDNAFVNRYGVERPSMRDTDGEPQFTIRREVAMENALGRGNSFVTSGGQWGGWNAVYGPRGADGLPRPIWDPRTGKIDRTVADAWKPYDLRLYLAQHWATLGPKMQGKLHIWMGDADNFYLNKAMHLLDDYLSTTTNPRSDATIVFGPGKGHGWMPFSDVELMRQMTVGVGP